MMYGASNAQSVKVMLNQVIPFNIKVQQISTLIKCLLS